MLTKDGSYPQDKEVIHRSPEYFKTILLRAADASDVVESGSFASEDRLLMVLLFVLLLVLLLLP